MQKCPRNRTTNKKNSSFELKWAKSQTKAQKNSRDDFIREIWWPVRETGRLVSYLGDSRIIRESWHVCLIVPCRGFSPASAAWFSVLKYEVVRVACQSRSWFVLYAPGDNIDANDSVKANFLLGCESLFPFFSREKGTVPHVLCVLSFQRVWTATHTRLTNLRPGFKRPT